MQQDGSVLSLAIGEQVCGELMNRWKTRGHGKVFNISYQGVSFEAWGVGHGTEEPPWC